MPVNPAAAEAKPKIQVAKKANILSQLPPTQQEPVRSQPPPSQPVPPSQPAPARATPRNDDDTGIVPIQREPIQREEPAARREPAKPAKEEVNPMVPRQQVQLRSREARDDVMGGSNTAGQKRAAAELDRIRREQARSAAEEPEEQPRTRSALSAAGGQSSRAPSSTPAGSRRPSVSSMATTGEGEVGALLGSWHSDRKLESRPP